ncbi:MAG: hypothetical protein NVSMB2_13910 [Chloroflexota bacterium]
MPRVNRDLQRRMAARRERERRRPPTEQRYRFGNSGATVDADASTTPQDSETASTPQASPGESSAAVRSGTARPSTPANTTAHRPFATYAADYAYVGRDLRRVAAVLGTLLALLVVLYLVLPH